MWPENDTKSYALTQRARRVFAGGSTRRRAWNDPCPIYISHGQGAQIHDIDGNRHFDLTNNFASLIHGHAHPQIVTAVNEWIGSGFTLTVTTEADMDGFGDALTEAMGA